MRKYIGLLAVCAGVITFPPQGYAQEQQAPSKAEEHINLMKRAVKFATKADAYNAYCSESPSTLASNYLDQFYLDESVSIAQKDELATVMEKEVKVFVELIQKDKPSCENVDFMLGRLEAMRELKNVSYLLNGIDPATIPEDNIPELKELLLSHDAKEPMPVVQ